MKILLYFMLLVMPGLSHADEDTYTKQYYDCVDKADGAGTLERILCMKPEIARQSAKLETAYKAALQQTPAERQGLLRESQRHWLKFLQANCDSFVGPDNAAFLSPAAEFRLRCVMRMTSERNIELRERHIFEEQM